MDRKNPFNTAEQNDDNSSENLFNFESDPLYERGQVEQKFNDAMKSTDPEVISNLSDGVLAECLPELQKCQSTLSEVTDNQKILLETLQQENAKFNTCYVLDATSELMNKAKLYHNVLLNIKQDMANIKDKSVKLKKRAIKLQQQKQRELLKKEQEKERELERERKLMAKPAKKSS